MGRKHNNNHHINPSELADLSATQITPELDINEMEPIVLEPVQEDMSEPVEEITPTPVVPESVEVAKVTEVTPEQAPTVAQVNIVKPVAPTEVTKDLNPKAETPAARVLQELIDRYTKYVTESPIVKPEECMKLFRGVLNYVINNTNDKTVLEKTYKFFLQNKKRLTNPAIALKGVWSITSSTSRDKVQAIYTLFCLSVTQNPGPIDWDKVSAMFIGTDLVPFIKQKVRANTK